MPDIKIRLTDAQFDAIDKYTRSIHQAPQSWIAQTATKVATVQLELQRLDENKRCRSSGLAPPPRGGASR